MHLTNYLHCVSFRRYRPLKLPLSCEVVQKGHFGPPVCRGRGCPRCWTCVFKSQLLSTMWPIFVEFGSASSEIRRRKKGRKKKKKESLVKHKSADTLCRAAKLSPCSTSHTVHYSYDIRYLLQSSKCRLCYGVILNVSEYISP